MSSTPPTHHSSGSVDDTEDIAKKDRANIKGKKRKRSKGEVLEDVMTKVMTDGLRDSDKMSTELEEKRMKFEEQQKREEREFKLRMIQMLQGGMGGNNFYPASYGHGMSPSTPSAGMYYGPPGPTHDYRLV